MIAGKHDAQGLMLCKHCIYCQGTGVLGVATAQNPSQYSTSNASCPSCIRGFVLITATEQEFNQWLDERMLLLFPHFVDQLQNGPLRSKFFDSLVAEVEQRIKDVELKILGAKPETTKSEAKRDWKEGDRCIVCTAPSSWHAGNVTRVYLEGSDQRFQIRLDDGRSVYRSTHELSAIETPMNLPKEGDTIHWRRGDLHQVGSLQIHEGVVLAVHQNSADEPRYDVKAADGVHRSIQLSSVISVESSLQF